jgi:hypothetical protein
MYTYIYITALSLYLLVMGMHPFAMACRLFVLYMYVCMYICMYV